MEKIINSIDEDLKYNGFRKWLIYLRYYIKHKEEFDNEDIDDIREKIVYNFNKENNIINNE